MPIRHHAMNTFFRFATMEKHLVTVCVPIHKPEPNELELISLRQCFNVLKSYPVTFVVRHDLPDVGWYERFAAENGKTDVYFERFEWDGFRGYSLLMLSPHFYERFLAYEYILIYHLDAFVFEDRLQEWCRLGYDYAGALVFNPTWERKSPALLRLLGLQFPDNLANGGFSLRKVRTLYRNLRRYKFLIGFFAKRNPVFLEDVFICHNLKKVNRSLRIPERTEMERFALEYVYVPENNFSSGDRLPFGCHGWIQYSPEFWKPYIRRFGHSL
jgi:Protein of unknown function (DUF5672)